MTHNRTPWATSWCIYSPTPTHSHFSVNRRQTKKRASQLITPAPLLLPPTALSQGLTCQTLSRVQRRAPYCRNRGWFCMFFGNIRNAARAKSAQRPVACWFFFFFTLSFFFSGDDSKEGILCDCCSDFFAKNYEGKPLLVLIGRVGYAEAKKDLRGSG